MSVNLYNATTDTLKNVAGDIVNARSVNEMVAPVEEGATASRAYSKGEQFIIDNVLYYAVTDIAQGEAFDYDVNYYESSSLSEQVDDKQNRTDLNLQTNSKTVVGAINELNDKVTPYVPSSLESATWAEISKSIEDGTLTQYAHIGDTKSFEMNGKTYHAEIVSINDGTGDAGQWYPDKTVDFICTELYETAYPYYTEQAAVGGFPNTELKETLVSTLYPLLPLDLKDVIVGKTHAYNTGGGTNTDTTDLWLPTHYEITGSIDTFAPEETALNNKAYTLTSKIKNLNGQSSAIAWWLGSTTNMYAYYWKVVANGNLTQDDGYLTLGVPICFRIGGDGSSLTPAKQISYDNTGIGLSSTDVQEAITELNTDLNAKQNITDNALRTTSKTVVGAINEVNSNATKKWSGTDSGNTYVTVDKLAYDPANKRLGLKVNGADTVIPFKKEIVIPKFEYTGRPSSPYPTTSFEIDVSDYSSLTISKFHSNGYYGEGKIYLDEVQIKSYLNTTQNISIDLSNSQKLKLWLQGRDSTSNITFGFTNIVIS